jgi:hypothetical protein
MSEDAQPELGKARIVVRSPNMMAPPLLETNGAHLIEFRDGFGELNALMVRIFSDEMWGLVTRNDPDWKSMLVRYGYLTDMSKPIEQVIRQGI